MPTTSWGSCSALFTADSVIILVRTVLSYHIVVLSKPFPLCLCFLAGLFFPYWQFVKICINLEFKACIMVSLCCVCLKLINDRTSLGVVLWRVVSQVLHVNERRCTHSARWLAQPPLARRAGKLLLCHSDAYSAYLSKDCVNMSAESVFVLIPRRKPYWGAPPRVFSQGSWVLPACCSLRSASVASAEVEGLLGDLELLDLAHQVWTPRPP